MTPSVSASASSAGRLASQLSSRPLHASVAPGRTSGLRGPQSPAHSETPSLSRSCSSLGTAPSQSPSSPSQASCALGEIDASPSLQSPSHSVTPSASSSVSLGPRLPSQSSSRSLHSSGRPGEIEASPSLQSPVQSEQPSPSASVQAFTRNVATAPPVLPSGSVASSTTACSPSGASLNTRNHSPSVPSPLITGSSPTVTVSLLAVITRDDRS